MPDLPEQTSLNARQHILQFVQKNYKNLFLGIILYWYQVASINNLLTKKDKKDRCQLAVSPALKAYPSLAYQLAFTIGNPYAEIYSKYENLTSPLIIILFCFKYM